VQDVKLNNEQAVAGRRDHRTFRNLQNTVKSVNSCLQEGVGQLSPTTVGIFEKIK
jgi:hypothetical protein